MIIIIKTGVESVEYKIKSLDNKTSNDEICRAIAHLEVIKHDLLNNLNYDVEIFEDKE